MKPLMYGIGLLLAALAGAVAVYLLRPVLPPPPPPGGPGNGVITCPGDLNCPDLNMAVPSNATAVPQGPAVREMRGLLFPKNLSSGANPVLLICDGSATPTNGCPVGYVGYLARQKNFELVVESCEAGRGACKPNYSALYCVYDSGDPPKKRACALFPGEYYPHP